MGLGDDKAVKAPFQIISQITKPFKQLNMMLCPEFAAKFTEKVSDLVVKRLSSLSEQDVKNCNKEEVECVMLNLNQVLKIGMSSSDRSRTVELIEL